LGVSAGLIGGLVRTIYNGNSFAAMALPSYSPAPTAGGALTGG
jgi:hypothetical protein